ncbi:DUF1353 domain-containing protein [Siphonobacter sp. SORGH_AS_0500]|uniref:DUF1353 domain-containing protein n=1 Tax=Siphonobacter sp. SORGH_AS_0500 TaxID=1864824 RepID=UPI002855C8B2|nr:DUF1353 domain-containing protein [Siphonobacter sp. SORGH_AS_0500]MDR6194740.1 hypothetical protein [Siphonobacter sp. SORGH_AS_0500]
MKIKVEYDTKHPKPDQFRVTKAFRLQADDGQKFTVWAGILTDGASIPSLFQSLVHPISRDFPADAFHDAYYMLNNSHHFSRLQVDLYWLEFMKRLNPNRPFRTYTKFLIVRIFGGCNWRYYNRLTLKQQIDEAFE